MVSYSKAAWRLRRCGLWGVSVLLAGCATSSVRPGPLVVFPVPPDTPRIQFLTRISGPGDVEKRRTFVDALIGTRPQAGEGIIKPFGVSIANGKMYVCDTVYRGVEIVDFARGSFDFFRPPDLPARMHTPVACVADRSNGRLYVVDTGRRAVFVFDSALAYVAHIEGDQAFRPSDAFADGHELWVADAGGHKIRIYDTKTLREVRSFPNLQPDEPGFLRQPSNLRVTNERVYVTDFGAFNVKVFDRAGRYLRTIGSYGDGMGQFVRPKGLAVDRQSLLYVADAAFNNVQVFDEAGRLLMFFGGNNAGAASMAFPAQVTIDYDNLQYFQRYVHASFELQYLILVTNQYGPGKVNVYGFVRPRKAS